MIGRRTKGTRTRLCGRGWYPEDLVPGMCVRVTFPLRNYVQIDGIERVAFSDDVDFKIKMLI